MCVVVVRRLRARSFESCLCRLLSLPGREGVVVLSCGLSLDGGDDDDRLVPNLITLAHLGNKQAPRVAMAVLGEEDLPAAGQGETAHSTCPASAVTKADAVSIIRRACLTLNLSVCCRSSAPVVVEVEGIGRYFPDCTWAGYLRSQRSGR